MPDSPAKGTAGEVPAALGALVKHVDPADYIALPGCARGVTYPPAAPGMVAAAAPSLAASPDAPVLLGDTPAADTSLYDKLKAAKMEGLKGKVEHELREERKTSCGQQAALEELKREYVALYRRTTMLDQLARRQQHEREDIDEALRTEKALVKQLRRSNSIFKDTAEAACQENRKLEASIRELESEQGSPGEGSEQETIVALKKQIRGLEKRCIVQQVDLTRATDQIRNYDTMLGGCVEDEFEKADAAAKDGDDEYQGRVEVLESIVKRLRAEQGQLGRMHIEAMFALKYLRIQMPTEVVEKELQFYRLNVEELEGKLTLAGIAFDPWLSPEQQKADDALAAEECSEEEFSEEEFSEEEEEYSD